MSTQGLTDRTRRRLVWAAPVVVAGVVLGGVALATGSASGSTPDLPQLTPKQLLVDAQHAAAPQLSGVVSETANLGLPSLPGNTSSASLSWQTFITGTHSAKVWLDGAGKQRAALQGELSEADVVHNGRDVWTYTSQTNTVTHTVLPARTGDHDHGAPTGGPGDLSPTQVATKLLDAVNPSTKVSVESPRMIADRPAYTLVLRPRDSRSTISKATISLDAKKFIPLQVQIFGSGSSPAIQVGFTSVSFQTPAASVFDFKTPAGATVATNPIAGHNGRHHGDGHWGHPGNRPHGAHKPLPPTIEPSDGYRHGGVPRVIGSGWTAVAELHDANRLLGQLPHELTTAGPNGSRLLHTALINAVILPDGRAFVGPLDQSALQHLAATTPN